MFFKCSNANSRGCVKSAKWSNVIHICVFVLIKETSNNSGNCIIGIGFVRIWANHTKILACHLDLICVSAFIMHHFTITSVQASQICELIIPNLEFSIEFERKKWFLTTKIESNIKFYYQFRSACRRFETCHWSPSNIVSVTIVNVQNQLLFIWTQLMNFGSIWTSSFQFLQRILMYLMVRKTTDISQ